MEEMKSSTFPPLVVVQTSDGYILADGFHRCEAAARLYGGDADIVTLCMLGTKRDALLFALGANNKHGLRRTNEDKRHTVLLALRDEELKRESNRSLARICGVSEFLVRSIRGGDHQETCDKIAPHPPPVHSEPAAPQPASPTADGDVAESEAYEPAQQCRECGTTGSREWIGHDGRWLCQQCYMAQALPPAAPPARNRIDQRQHILNMIEGIRAYVGGDGIKILTQQEFNRRLGVLLDVIEGYIEGNTSSN